MKKSNFSSIHQFSTYLLLIIFLAGIFAFSKSKNTTPTVSVAADKMNIFYIGIDNPITVAVEGAYSEDLIVQCEDGKVTDLGGGHYNVRVQEPGKKKVTVMAKGVTTQEVTYRVKRVPDPRARIGYNSGGTISKEYLLNAKKVNAYLENWVREEKCEIQEYYMTWQREGADVMEVIIQGANFSKPALELLKNAQSDDVFYFDQVKCKCPGDSASRKINSMVFKIR